MRDLHNELGVVLSVPKLPYIRSWAMRVQLQPTRGFFKKLGEYSPDADYLDNSG